MSGISSDTPWVEASIKVRVDEALTSFSQLENKITKLINSLNDLNNLDTKKFEDLDKVLGEIIVSINGLNVSLNKLNTG